MEAERSSAKSRASSVLVVDDESEPRQSLALLLASAGFDVHEACDAQAATDALAGGDIGIVVVDADMPNVNGFELCRDIRKARGTETYLILRTSKEQLSSRDLTADEGADDYLLEPVSDPEVLARVETGRKMKQLQEKLEETHRSLELLDVTDPLTGALNSRRISSEIGREMDRARRYGRPLSLVLLNIDAFREFNDAHGRAAGDRVLSEVGRVLRLSTRTTDTVGRIGGDELAVILPETDKPQGLGAAEKMRGIIEQTAIATGDGTANVTVSGGIATLEGNNYETVDILTAAARQALVSAKDSGRNRCMAAD
jgi:diguanylate cyclase (GGDEF)-like protein